MHRYTYAENTHVQPCELIIQTSKFSFQITQHVSIMAQIEQLLAMQSSLHYTSFFVTAALFLITTCALVLKKKRRFQLLLLT